MNPWKLLRRPPLLASLLGLTALATGCGGTELDPADDEPLAQARGALAGDSVTVYQHDNFGGASLSLQPGSYDYWSLVGTVGNDTISSLRVPTGWKVTLYQDAYFAGRQKVITSDTDLWLNGDFNDMTSSIKIEGSDLPNKAVVEHFFPTIRFANGEDCIAPAQFDQKTGVALYHVGLHPRNAARVMVTFGLVYKQDCGHWGNKDDMGAESHAGDIEYFSYTLKKDTSCSIGWRLHAVKTHAHGGNIYTRELNERILDSCTAPELVTSLGKHALYTSWDDCLRRTPVEYCIGNRTAGFNLYDIGDSAGQGPNLRALFNSPDYRDSIWPADGDGRFCGGKSVSNRFDNPDDDCVNAPGERLARLGSQASDKEWYLPDPDLGTANGCIYGLQMQGGLCYEPCKSGFYGNLTVCHAYCPSGFGDDGAYTCYKPAPYTLTDKGFPWKFGDGFSDSGMFDRCEAVYGDNNCQKLGAVVYPKCRTGYHTIALECSPDCPANTTDTGAFCTKTNSYDRHGGAIP